MFMHGNYDGTEHNLVRSPLVFDVYMGLHFWDRISVNNKAKTYIAEVIVVAEVNSISVCLMDIGKGTPFVSSLEMRPMKSSLYPASMRNQSIALQERHSRGTNSLVRYPDDPYDRLWWPWPGSSGLLNISTNETIKRYQDDIFEVPSKVLQTAVTSPATSIPLNFSWTAPTIWPEAVPGYYVNIHYTEFQKPQGHQFNTYYNGYLWTTYNPVIPPYLLAGYKYSTSQYTSDNSGFYNITLAAANTSILPPILGAFEIHYLVQHDSILTSPEDVDAMISMKTEYQVKKNWMGNPCLPESYTWIGLKCQSDGVMSRVISLNLSYNDLNGPVPDSLVNLPYLLTLFDTTNGDPCNRKSPKKKSTTVITAAIVASAILVAFLISAFIVCYFCRKQARNMLLRCADVPGTTSKEDREDNNIHLSDGRQFTFKELTEMTNNFSMCIGEGGFGPVFHGRLKEGCSSPTSTIGKGMEEFLAEVESLTTVHHRDKNHLALIYEYMPNGSLYDHIRGLVICKLHVGFYYAMPLLKKIVENMQLPKHCDGVIEHELHLKLHKSHNILLGFDMVAKISDFGLSRSYLNAAQSHISVSAAGTLGYIDPEYCLSGRLTISSDVFSFGVVLLEVVTGEPPIISTAFHIVQRVKEKVAMGNIEGIVDPRFGVEYDPNSIWKVVDIALLCTKEASQERPTMSTVVAQLKDALALEEARAGGSIGDISQGGANFDLSISSLLSER
uniref:Protein kinase domain-containing protein n=1 Tax=Leersia perrieri TaxID=77586 RepID=A0A0D9XCT7_9ORYZ